MSINTLNKGAPSFMRERGSPLSQLVFYSALALFLMVADARFHIVEPLRSAVSAVLYPLQWAMFQPVQLVERGTDYFVTLDTAQREASEAREAMARLAQRAQQAQDLVEENDRLRGLLELRDRLEVPAQAGQILYELPDLYTRRVVVDRGSMQGVVPGSPVLDELGVFGQVVRVHPFVSEVVLVSDPELSVPVINTRTGVRGVAYGAPGQNPQGGMELRYMASNADVRAGDLLATSGMDGVYPPGLPVAEVVEVARRADSPFSRVYSTPLARVQGARHVMVLSPLSAHLPTRPEEGEEGQTAPATTSASPGSLPARSQTTKPTSAAAVAVPASANPKPAANATTPPPAASQPAAGTARNSAAAPAAAARPPAAAPAVTPPRSAP